MRFAPWYRREDYALLREIMDDGEDTLPLAFDEWERNAECERAAAKTRGNNHNSGFHRPRRVFLVLYAAENPAQQNDARGICQQPRGCKLLHGDVSLTMEPSHGTEVASKKTAHKRSGPRS